MTAAQGWNTWLAQILGRGSGLTTGTSKCTIHGAKAAHSRLGLLSSERQTAPRHCAGIHPLWLVATDRPHLHEIVQLPVECKVCLCVGGRKEGVPGFVVVVVFPTGECV